MPESAVVLVENDRVRVFGKKIEQLPSDDTKARIVLSLRRNKEGMTGSQLARELDVSQTMVVKAANELRNLGIVRKEPLKHARNVKVYYLATRIIDDAEIAEMKRRVPPVLQELMAKRFRGQEHVGLVFADQVMRFLARLKAHERPEVLSEYLRLAGEKTLDEDSV
ncbi:MAG: winged helix-turn-helix transcriptional regulator [Thaumarchaeota archaeon]|nr:winged helix-turn-helix transcriptional regulator [Nitrososphaerota archaeon]